MSDEQATVVRDRALYALTDELSEVKQKLASTQAALRAAKANCKAAQRALAEAYASMPDLPARDCDL